MAWSKNGRPREGQGKASGEGGVLLPLGKPPGERHRAPVLVFGRWRLPMSEAEAARLEAVIAAHCEANGSPFGLVGALLRAL